MNDSQASAMNAEASEPASAATPTSRGTSSVKIWVRTTTTIPITIAGISADRQRGALGGRNR